MIVLTQKLLDAAMTENGGYNDAQLSVFGLRNRGLLKGWKKKLIGTQIDDGLYNQFLSLRDQEKGKNFRRMRRKEEKEKRKKEKLASKIRVSKEVSRIKKRISEYGSDKLSTPSVADKDFLQTYEWRKLRMQVIKKYGARCQCCGASPATGAVINVDHIKPRKLFPKLALSLENLQVLCHECNHGKGNWDQTDWRQEEASLEEESLSHIKSILQEF